MRASLPLATCLFALLAGLVAACGDGGPPAEPDAKKAETTETVADADSTDVGPGTVFTTAKQCGQCHREIYEEWKASYHGRAMSDPLFRELSAEVNKEECIRCHAPVTLREAGFETPIARSDLREDAISCLTCHDTGDGMAGPSQGLTGACRPVYDPQQSDVVKMCFVCHNQHDTGNEWLRGPYSPEAPEPRVRDVKTCLDCHMPEVERSIVPGGPVRKVRRHTWYGGHSITMLRKAAEIDVVSEALPDGGHRFRVFVTNVGAGHMMPTDARHRSFDTYVLVRDAAGKILLDPTDPQQQSRAHLAKFRKFYRGSGKKDTQIPPLARVDTLGEGPGYVDLPEASSGTGEAWLVYRLTPRDVLNKRSLDEGDPHDIDRLYRARVVIRKEFTYGK
ncbi:MAG: multiheme c-type cytochrome [Planctomycetota bacterium]|nr:multiheme c-type cytochrome [Planctomycetota bacterium]